MMESGVAEQERDDSFDVLVSADSAIESDGEDLLNRKGYADSIAGMLRRLPRRCTVVSLNGSWGSGKSSTKNLVLRRLEAVPSEITIVLFNPWQFESTEQLTREFFAELAHAAFGSYNDAEGRQRRGKMMQYASRVANLASVAFTVSTPLSGPLGIGIGRGLDQIAKVLETGGAGLVDSATQHSLSRLKLELSSDLAQVAPPILVVIDDIDRLTDDEVRLVFKLVKANADFPNVHYLLLFDREQVVRALGANSEIGSAFLEKIVNVGFDMPPIVYEDLARILDEGLEDLLTDGRVKSALDSARWAKMRQEVLLAGFDTVRHVRRFLNAIRVATNALLDDMGMNADFADLCGLEFLRTMEPVLFQEVRSAGFLLSEYGPLMNMALNGDEHPTRLEVILKPYEGDRRRVVKGALDLMFPHVDWENLTWSGTGDSTVHLRKKRLWRAAFRNGYYGLDHGRVSISEARLSALGSGLERPEQVGDFLEGVLAHERLHALQVIEARIESIPREHWKIMLAGLFRWADSQPGIIRTSFLDPTPKSAIEAIAETMLSATASDEREDLLLGAMDLAQTFTLGSWVVGHEKGRHEDARDTPLLDADALSRVIGRVSAAIQGEADSGRLLDAPDLYSAVLGWGWVSTTSAPNNWIASLAGNPDAVERYLLGVVVPQLGDDWADAHWRRIRSRMAYTDEVRMLEGDLLQIRAKPGLDHRLLAAVDECLRLAKEDASGQADSIGSEEEGDPQ